MWQLSKLYDDYPLNHQVFLYDGNDIHFDDQAIDILRSYHAQPFLPKSGDSSNDQPNYNGLNLTFEALYNKAKSKLHTNFGTTSFAASHMNYLSVDVWQDFKVTASTVIRDRSPKKHLTPLQPTNHAATTQDFVALLKIYSGKIVDEISALAKGSIAPMELKVTIMPGSIVILDEQSNKQLSRNLILRAAEFDEVRQHTVLPIQEFK